MDRPYVIVNCAMSADGKIALPTRKQLRISCNEDLQRMYRLRNDCDAVLVGIETVLSDDPKLTVKDKYVKNPKQPIRIVLDAYCRTPQNSMVVNSVSKTLIVVKIGSAKRCKNKFEKNVEIVECKSNENGFIDLEEMLKILFKKGIEKLMVEGGSTVIWNFLKEGFVDEMFVYIGPMIVGGKNTPTLADGGGIKDIGEIISLEIVDVKRLGDGILVHYKIKG